jgi:periplasmic mercuric ion binding protein
MLRRSFAFAIFCVAASAVNASDSQRTVLDVRGMDCAACPITVKTVLRKQPGVEDVKVDFSKSTAEITFDPSKVSRERLAQAVTEAGFPSTPRK